MRDYKREYKWIIFLATVLVLSMLLPACTANGGSNFPYLEYFNSGYRFDPYNQLIRLPDGYILNQGHPYDIVETDAGCDVIIHYLIEG